MVTPDWNIFKAKFSGKEQKIFEWFCYLLFCEEFNRLKGIMRYINQAGIETNPIDVNGQNIGWQAKFFETRLSEHTKDFMKSIDVTKKKYPKINKILFYTNQDFGQGKTNSKSKYEIEIENHARDKRIEIEWRTGSFFESPFVCEENKIIAQHFFTQGKSSFDLINELSRHTQSILNQIHSEIKFNNQEIKINRSDILEKLTASSSCSRPIILNGEAGVGKTAVIKDFYEANKNKYPFFIFKAVEFNKPHINQLFKDYGDFSLSDFIEFHQKVEKKYIIIDSAEKLSDIENTEPFQEFLSSLIEAQWRIIFTTRYSYFDDLVYQLEKIYKIECSHLNIQKLTDKEISELSGKYNFNLPQNTKWLNLLKTPFYLNEYLGNYSEMEAASYSKFKKIIWDKKILNSSFKRNNIHRKRERYFLSIAKKRATTGNFFIETSHLDQNILQKLEADEIINYNQKRGGHFITHDIYEEWALDTIIERAFCNKEDYKSFFNSMGDSLPVRRAFRGWLSEKLGAENQEIKAFIEGNIQDQDIKKHWRDEILVSVLLSSYCSHFFKIFETELLEKPKQSADNKLQNRLQPHYEQRLLYKLLFLLRIACKEADESIFKAYRLPETDKNKEAFETIFIKPKGEGWICLIDFLNKHKENFDLSFINLILPVIEDWNIKNKKGKTTKNASQLALFYYEKIMDEEYSFKYKDIKKQLIKTIFNGSFEVKEELKKIFQPVISKRETKHNSRYYQLAHSVLSEPMESIEAIKNVPEQVMQLADLFWAYQPKKEKLTLGKIPIPDRGLNLEKCFSITNHYKFKYFPPSPFNTPILPLLIFSYKRTVDFILSFTNKSIENLASSKFARELEEVEVFIDDQVSVKQYFNPMLWNMYRGNQAAPHLLESMHMALERYFLENCKDMDSSALEERLLYLLKNSKSSSISAVVGSIVLAYPEKTFNVAKILFKTKEFIICDKLRAMSDQRPINFILSNEEPLFNNERMKFHKLEHRKNSLELLALQYQFYSFNKITKQEKNNRQQTLWKIFDNYYQHLPKQNDEIEKDRKWKLCLARMDYRKMKLTVEKINGQKLIKFNPEVEPYLKKHSEDILKKLNKENKYFLLKLWAEYKFENRAEHKNKDYLKYENNPKLVIKETKDIIQKLENIPGDFTFPFFSKQAPSFAAHQRIMLEREQENENGFRTANHSIPLYACAVLIRDHLDQLNQEDKIFCWEIIVKCASYLIQDDNPWSVSDADVVIKTLSFAINALPEKKSQIKSMLFKLLIKEGDLNKHIISAISGMWEEENFEDAHSLFLGYLLLKQKFDSLRMENQPSMSRISDNRKFKSASQILEEFFKSHKKDMEDIIGCSLTYKAVSETSNLKEFRLDNLITAFEMLPLKIENEEHKEFIKNITAACLEKLFISNGLSNSYELKFRFMKKFADFILTLKTEEIGAYLKPFLDNFEKIRAPGYQELFFSSFVSAEDKLSQYENFWTVWNLFYPKIKEICQKNISNFDTVIYNYLLAGPLWKKDARDWHSLKEREKMFFKEVSKDIGHHPVVLDSILIFLNGIGSSFKNNGIFWISDIIKSNPNLSKIGLETNTVFYMENLIRGYIFENRQIIKTDFQKRQQILIVLNFLIEKGSAAAYRLREHIL